MRALQVLAAVGGIALTGPLPALESDREQPLIFEADRITANEKAQLTTLTGDVLLMQGTLEIHAATARLHGPVAALQRMVVEGEPATLSQQLDEEPGILKAQAARIAYDPQTRIIELTGDAVVEQGNRRLSGEHITYNLASGRVAGQGGDGRVRVRIEPEEPADSPSASN